MGLVKVHLDLHLALIGLATGATLLAMAVIATQCYCLCSNRGHHRVEQLNKCN